jgi:hypothetical protein
MRQFRTVFFATAALLLGAMPAQAFRKPDLNPAYPIQHVREARLAEKSQPYAMNYTDEMAQSLGVRDGRWEAFDTGSKHPLVPSLKGGIDSGGAMLRLQWRQ